MREVLKFILFLAGLVALVLGLVRYFLVDEYVVSGVGMVPTLLPGERALAFRDPEKLTVGDIVVCQHPRQSSFVLGRILAVEGQTLSAPRGQLQLNGRVLDTNIDGVTTYQNPVHQRVENVRVVRETTTSDRSHWMMVDANRDFVLRETLVTPGKLFLLGDHRGFLGEDSRSFGLVDRSTCRGRIFMRFGAVEGAPGPAHRRVEFLD